MIELYILGYFLRKGEKIIIIIIIIIIKKKDIRNETLSDLFIYLLILQIESNCGLITVLCITQKNRKNIIRKKNVTK